MANKRSFNKRTLLAHHDMERLSLNPIEMLKTIYDEALNAYRSGRGLSDKGDAGAAYLSVAGKAASDLAGYKHPKLSAMAIADFTEDSEKRRALTTEEAINIIKGDPFAPEGVRAIDTKRVLESLKSTIQIPSLPMGESNED